MCPDSKRSRAKSPSPLLLLWAIWPGAAYPGDCFGTPGNQAIYCPEWGLGLLGQTGWGKTTTTTTTLASIGGRLFAVDVAFRLTVAFPQGSGLARADSLRNNNNNNHLAYVATGSRNILIYWIVCLLLIFLSNNFYVWYYEIRFLIYWWDVGLY